MRGDQRPGRWAVRLTLLAQSTPSLPAACEAYRGLQDEPTPDVAEKDVTVARIYDTKQAIPETMKGTSYVLTTSALVRTQLLPFCYDEASMTTSWVALWSSSVTGTRCAAR